MENETNLNPDNSTDLSNMICSAEETPQPPIVDNTVDNTENKTKTKIGIRGLQFFKSWKGYAALGIIALVATIAIIAISTAHSEQSYKKNLKAFIEESTKSTLASSYICEDLRSIWSGYIFDDRKYFVNSTGSFTSYGYDADEYCPNFSEAVNRKIKWNNTHLPAEITQCYDKAKELYKEMTPAPGKYSDIHVYVKQMYKAMERLHELSQNPTGNLSSFTDSVNEELEKYTSALSDLTTESDIDFDEIESSIDDDDEFEN